MVKSSLIRKKAQIWGADIFVAAVIFSVAIILFYFFALNKFGETEEKIEALSYEGKFISNILMSDGYPEDWNYQNVIEMGILSNNKINETKLERFYNFSQSNYSYSKRVFNTIYDYYFFLDRNMTIGTLEVEGIGKPGAKKENIVAKNLIRTERITFYQNKLAVATLYIWEE